MTAPAWDTAGVTATYQWFQDATAFTNNAMTYTVTSGDVGKTITVKATAAKTGYVSGASTSNGILATQAAAVTPTTLPSITGVPAAKETLTAIPGVWPGSGRSTPTSGSSTARRWPRRRAASTSSGPATRATGVGASHDDDDRLRTERGHQRRPSVAKLSSTTTRAAAKKKITQRQRAVLTVKVSLLDFGVSLGEVQVKDGSKVIANPGLQTGKNGVLTIRLKKLKLGKHKLTITYLGSVSTLSSSAKVTIKVVKGPTK